MARLILLTMLIGLHTGTSILDYGPGPCPEVTTTSNFSFDAYAGDWYVVAESSSFMHVLYRCRRVTIVKLIGSRRWAYQDRSIMIWSGQETKTEVDMTLLASAKGLYTIPAATSAFTDMFFGNVVVIDTDYRTYALEWSCKDLYFLHSPAVRILARQPVQLNTTIMDRIINKVRLNSLNFPVSQNPTMCPAR